MALLHMFIKFILKIITRLSTCNKSQTSGMRNKKPISLKKKGNKNQYCNKELDQMRRLLSKD